jgi:hypothetical protein
MAVYGELADDQHHLLDQHLNACADCRRELEGVEALAKAMSLLPVEEPSANLLARSRLRLEEALDALPRSRWALRLFQQFTNGAYRLRSTPIAASTLLVFGLAGGAYGGFRFGVHAEAQRAEQAFGDHEQVAAVSSIAQDPRSNKVDVHYYRLVPESRQGSLENPDIQALLVAGARNRIDPEVRDHSVVLLAQACRAAHQCSDGPMRTALMVSLLYDNSPDNRLTALTGLEPYIADNTEVRDAVLQSVLKDTDERVRTRAINLLAPVQADSSVQDVLHTVAVRDDNPEIRTASQHALSQIEQIQ